jgi:predicted transcriptional regulator of viral defense system
MHHIHTGNVICYHPGMPSKHADTALRLTASQPAVATRELVAAGLTANAISRLAATGQLRRVSRGLYSGVQTAPSVHQSAIEVAKQSPRAVICLLSALEIHEVGVQAPFEVWIALPAGTHAPKGGGTQLRVTRLSGPAFSEGIETRIIDGAPVRVYGLAKTITDCFKLRGKVGLEVALEALREGWKARKFTMEELWRFAEINRMTRVMRPYVEAVTG